MSTALSDFARDDIALMFAPILDIGLPAPEEELRAQIRTVGWKVAQKYGVAGLDELRVLAVRMVADRVRQLGSE